MTGAVAHYLSKDFLRLILIAFLVAAPVAALVITCVAVGFQTIKAAVTNPVKSLKTE